MLCNDDDDDDVFVGDMGTLQEGFCVWFVWGH